MIDCKKLLVLAGVFALTSCVQTEKEVVEPKPRIAMSSVWDQPISLLAGTRIAIEPQVFPSNKLTPEQQQKIFAIYQEKIAEGLRKKGAIVDSQYGKFKLKYTIVLADNIDQKLMESAFAISPGLHTGSENKGSFLMAVEDQFSKTRVWRAAAQGYVEPNLTEEQRKQKAEQVVDQMLVQFFKGS